MSTQPPTLAARLEQSGPLPWREAARLTARLARLLDRVHAQGRAHGGIEPSTVLFVGGTVRLADPLPSETRHPAFVDPRLVAGEAADRGSDFYALGRTLAAMVGPDPHALPAEFSTGDLPPPLLAVQRRLVGQDAASGYGSGNDVAAALELAIAASEGFVPVIPEPSPEPEPQPLPLGDPLSSPPSGPERQGSMLPPAAASGPEPHRRRRRRRPRAVAGLLALLLIGGAVVFGLRPSGEPAVEQPAATIDPAGVPLGKASAEAEPLPGATPSVNAPAVTDDLPLEEVLAMLPDLPLEQPPAGPSTRAGLEALLGNLKARPCTRLEVEPTTVGWRIVGTTSDAAQRTELLDEIGALEDIDKVTLELDPSGDFCRLYDMLAAHTETVLPRLADLFPPRPDYRLVEGEPLVLRVLTPPFPSHLKVDYLTADGMVVHLAMQHAEAERFPPVEEVWIGDPADGRWLTIAEPFGHEVVLVIASAAPLFAEPRSRIEPADAYLDALEAALEAQSEKPTASTIAIRTIPATP